MSSTPLDVALTAGAVTVIADLNAHFSYVTPLPPGGCPAITGFTLYEPTINPIDPPNPLNYSSGDFTLNGTALELTHTNTGTFVVLIKATAAGYSGELAYFLTTANVSAPDCTTATLSLPGGGAMLQYTPLYNTSIGLQIDVEIDNITTTDMSGSCPLDTWSIHDDNVGTAYSGSAITLSGNDIVLQNGGLTAYTVTTFWLKVWSAGFTSQSEYR